MATASAGMNAEGLFEKVEHKSKRLAVGSGIGRALTSALQAPVALMGACAWLTKVGIGGWLTGWTGKKISQK